jgi:flavorubredoxin
MVRVDEIAKDVFRLSVLEPGLGLQFNHFLIRDDEPLLFHAGYKALFAELYPAVRRLIDVSRLRWVGFSHFESDECGGLNQWLDVAPLAQPVCSLVGTIVSVNDFSSRPARGLSEGEVFSTGRYRYRFCSTAHMPHGWDAGLLFEETQQTLFCSDLLFHAGDVEPVTEADIVGRAGAALADLENGPLAGSVPYTVHTERILEGLAALQPRTLATMHGSSFIGDGGRALQDYKLLLRKMFAATP